jgi:hypothetical protein
MLDFALPDDKYSPAYRFKSRATGGISQLIALKLGLPILKIRAGNVSKLATGCTVLMPEASVNEDNFAACRENHVGSPRKGMAMKPVSETHPMNQAPHSKFRLHVLAADRAHICAAVH